MTPNRPKGTLMGAAFVLASVISAQAGAQDLPSAAATAPDSGLFATYSFFGNTTVDVSVCGSVPGTGGCYGSGQMTGFGHVGALIEGNPHVDTATNTVTRSIYVVDQSVSGGSGVALVVYKLTEAIDAPFATVTLTKNRTIPLPQLTGGATARTFIAGNAKFLFIGTDKSLNAVKVTKSGYALQAVGGFSPDGDVSAITADKYGFVTVTFGTVSGSDASYVFDANGALEQSGGGAEYMAGTTAGLSTSDIRQSTSAPAAQRIGIRYRGVSK